MRIGPFFFFILFGSLLANAQNDKLVQVGQQACPLKLITLNSSPVSLEGDCDVTFNDPFGSPPAVTVSASEISLSLTNPPTFSVTAKNITSAKFTVHVKTSPPNPPLMITTPTATVGWVAVGPAIFHVTAQPHYVVLSVVYAPPGGNGGRGQSSVAYQSGKTTGTTTSVSNSFKQDYKLSASVSGGILGKFEDEMTLGWSKNTTDDQSLDLKETLLRTMTYPGPNKDGLDHNYDRIILWLNPTVEVALSSTGAVWTFNAKAPNNRIFPVYVGWLNGILAFPPEEKQILTTYNIGPTDFCEILKRDPLADSGASCGNVSGVAVPDADRYLPIGEPIVYQRAATRADTPATNTFVRTVALTSTTGKTIEDSYSVSNKLSGGADALGIAATKMSLTTSWTWSHKNVASNSNSDTATATATITGPSFDYSGRTFLQVYLDTVYKTFAFSFVNDLQIAVKGTVMKAGRPVPAGTEVVLIETREFPTFTSQVEHRATTNSSGGFVFFGKMSGKGILKTGSIRRNITLPNAGAPVTVTLQ